MEKLLWPDFASSSLGGGGQADGRCHPGSGGSEALLIDDSILELEEL